MSIKIPAEKLVEVGLKNEGELLAIQEVLAPEKKVEIKSDFKETDAKVFRENRLKSKRPQWLTDYTAEQYVSEGIKTYTSNDGKVGYAIKPDGDIISVYNHSGVKGAGKTALLDAIKRGGKKLDAVGEYLAVYYEKFGFEVVKREKWNDKYAPPQWDYKGEGRPDIIYMELKSNGKTIKHEPQRSTGTSTDPTRVERDIKETTRDKVDTGRGGSSSEGLAQVSDSSVKTPTDKSKTSGLAKSIEAKAIEQGIIEKGAADLAEFEGVKLKEQAKMGADLVNTGIDNLRATIRGEKPLPEGMTNFSAILAAEEALLKNPNKDLAYDLANSPLVTAVSEAASELSSGQGRIQDSATFRLQQVKKHRIKKAETLTKETPQTIRKAIRKEVKKNNLSKAEQKWDKFLDEIKC
jgi:hypothetical protein